MDKKAVVLLSGGLDSSTCCAIAKSEGFEIYAMSFAYGQRHQVELSASRRVAAFFSVSEHRIVTIDLAAFGGSSLTSSLEVPKDRFGKKQAGEIPNTYVPGRNTIFLSFALGWAEVLECRDIFIGVNALDYSGYPDCRPDYIAAFQTMANLATKAAVEGNKLIIHTPLINLTKAQIIKLGMNLGVDYSFTHSCYDPSPEGLACGACDSCLLRKKGFEEAGINDVTRYRDLK
ncbi:MAG: 7-cyano-7-deazaguanine synthase QueC [Chitinivibrionales bacterium]